MEKHPSSLNQSSFVFNIEVLVEGSNNAVALEKLLHALNNHSELVDFRILSGIKLGELIDERKQNAAATQDVPVQAVESNEVKSHAKSADKLEAPSFETLSYFDKIRAIMKNNTLVRLIVNKGLGIKLNIPCRIINMDEAENIITVYHVDEKQVYTFRLNEVEDFTY
ncbi:hypothetical protein [Paenibacillus sp. PL91]|uniref:hypothetical protein n=1 Tax=Paenibacillus sp. PL91 TaxID=2729538 RepID=UPI00145C5A1A|nr:hypothetical protein [Paenibacillus sp. PL91]MBC9200938.1 hypothetical protein [Paenibacillus sp. PL91]